MIKLTRKQHDAFRLYWMIEILHSFQLILERYLVLPVHLNHLLICRGLFKVDMQMCYMLCRLLMLLSFWTPTLQTGTGLIPYWMSIEKLTQCKRRNWFYVRFNNIWTQTRCRQSTILCLFSGWKPFRFNSFLLALCRPYCILSGPNYSPWGSEFYVVWWGIALCVLNYGS
jgi:hypothetical protein